MTFPPLHAHALLVQAAPSGNPLMPLLFQIGLIFVIVYFLLLRPQQKQRRQHEASIRALRKGDQIVTAGGIVGEVIHIRESTKDGEPAPAMEDNVTIRTGDTRVIVERGRIARILPRAGEVETS